MNRAPKKAANPHAWSDADYEAKGLHKLTIRISKKALAHLESAARKLGISRASVVEIAAEKIDRETKKDS